MVVADIVTSLAFWIALAQIVAINFALSGNNGLVIALAARSLPPDRRRRAIVWGIVVAIAVRILFTVIAFGMLRLPFMKIAGGVLLVWVAVQLLLPAAEQEPGRPESNSIFDSTAYRIFLGNLVMSLDNVTGVAAAAADNSSMLVFGLVVSVMMITSGSAVVTAVMNRFPAVHTLCAGLIAYLAGNMMVGDVAIRGWIALHLRWLKGTDLDHVGLSIAGLVGVAAVFSLARLLHFLSEWRFENAVKSEAGRLPGSSSGQGPKGPTARLSGHRMLSLLPFAVVIAVTYLGHPLFVHFGGRLLPQTRYAGIRLGMTEAEVIRAKGYPEYVGERMTDGRRPQLRLSEIPAGKALTDYLVWEFPMGRSAPASLEISYSRETRQVDRISCYSERGYCPPVSGISTGASEDEVMEKLGTPSVAKANGETQTLDYPDLRLSVLLDRKRVMMLSVHEFENARSRTPGGPGHL
jgi:YjbE family integral membrane protein